MFSKIKKFNEELKEEPLENRMSFCIYTLAWFIFLILFIESIYVTQTFPIVEFCSLIFAHMGFKSRKDWCGSLFMISTVFASFLINFGSMIL